MTTRPNETIRHTRHGRRGSALMVALALLMMLAVFATLFLTASRFDTEGSTADLDYLRMDLYAEGMAQYVQWCMVADLWGTDDDLPLNYDDAPPPGPYTRTPSPGVVLTRMPGPDNPIDHFAGKVPVDLEPTVPGYDTWYFPDWWLTDPRVHLASDPQVGGAPVRRYLHPAFAPDGLPQNTIPGGFDPNTAPPFDIDPGSLTLAQQAQFWWRWADLDGDDRADTPWLFQKPLGNDLYLRVAVRVEDTSSRFNVNVADSPVFVDYTPQGGETRTTPEPLALTYYPEWSSGTYAPYMSRLETLLRQSIYAGYPWVGAKDLTTSAFVRLLTDPFPGFMQTNSITDQDNHLFWEEQVGTFRSEANLTQEVRRWLGLPAVGGNPSEAYLLSDGFYIAGPPVQVGIGRHGTQTGATVVRYPAVSYINGGTLQPPSSVGNLIGRPDLGDPARTGGVWDPAAWGGTWNPQMWDFTATGTWATFDPDALVRRLAAPLNLSAVPLEQDRPFGSDETFDLMSLRGYDFKDQAGTVYVPFGHRYDPDGGLPTRSRIEALWPDVLINDTNAFQIQWRRLLTSYSWSLDLCPYGEDPHDDDSYRKLNLNALGTTAAEADKLNEALQAAGRHPASPGALLSQDAREQFVANFLNYRERPLSPTQLAYYLRERLSVLQAAGEPLPPANAAWSELAWRTDAKSFLNMVARIDEESYLTGLFGNWPGAPATFWAQIRQILEYKDPVLPYISNADPQDYGGKFGYARHPFITEVWMDIGYAHDVHRDGGKDDPRTPGFDEAADDLANRPSQAGSRNAYALELYNPWDTYIYLDDWFIRVQTDTYTYEVPLSPAGTPRFIPPHGRFVVARHDPTGTADIETDSDPKDNQLIIAVQPWNPPPLGQGPTIELVYRQGTAEAVYDNVPGIWTREFSGAGVSGSGVPSARSIVRRDDNGFWCYQRWAEQRQSATGVLGINTLGAPNEWNDASGVFMYNDPWNVDVDAMPEPVLGANPAVPVIGVGHLLSPAELALIPYDVPAQSGTGGSKTYADAITPYDRTLDGMTAPYMGSPEPQLTYVQRYTGVGLSDVATAPTPARPMLFHRWPTSLVVAGPFSQIEDWSGAYVGTFQSLMDFVTVADYTQDDIDDDGSGGTPDTLPQEAAEGRVPGRLNINTVADWHSLDQLRMWINMPNALTTETPASEEYALATWRRLFEYRDLRDPYEAIANAVDGADDWYPMVVNGRSITVGAPVREATTTDELQAFLGFERLAEICSVQNAAQPGYGGFWQNPTRDDDDTTHLPLLFQQHMRKFARNMNMLNTRSDTYMVTVRVEIVRATPGGLDYTIPANLATLQQLDVLGQREYMYLVDRSYCTQAPQKDVSGTMRYNEDFIPPRVWRMSVPSYVGM